MQVNELFQRLVAAWRYGEGNKSCSDEYLLSITFRQFRNEDILKWWNMGNMTEADIELARIAWRLQH